MTLCLPARYPTWTAESARSDLAARPRRIPSCRRAARGVSSLSGGRPRGPPIFALPDDAGLCVNTTCNSTRNGLPSHRPRTGHAEERNLEHRTRPILWSLSTCFSRLPVLLDRTSGKAGDIALKLDSAGRRLGYPERLWLDHGMNSACWSLANGLTCAGSSSFLARISRKTPLLGDFSNICASTSTTPVRRIPLERLRKMLRGLGIDSMHMECLNLAVQLLGFNDWWHFNRRDLDAPLSALDERLCDAEFAARDEDGLADAVAGSARIAGPCGPDRLLEQEGRRDGGGLGTRLEAASLSQSRNGGPDPGRPEKSTARPPRIDRPLRGHITRGWGHRGCARL
jgi:hypothetical protein